LTCTSPQAADVKHALGQGAFDEVRNMSPTGLPLMCCKVTIAGALPAAGEARLGNANR
jgi:hypothetical protein